MAEVRAEVAARCKALSAERNEVDPDRVARCMKAACS